MVLALTRLHLLLSNLALTPLHLFTHNLYCRCPTLSLSFGFFFWPFQGNIDDLGRGFVFFEPAMLTNKLINKLLHATLT